MSIFNTRFRNGWSFNIELEYKNRTPPKMYIIIYLFYLFWKINLNRIHQKNFLENFFHRWTNIYLFCSSLDIGILAVDLTICYTIYYINVCCSFIVLKLSLGLICVWFKLIQYETSVCSFHSLLPSHTQSMNNINLSGCCNQLFQKCVGMYCFFVFCFMFFFLLFFFKDYKLNFYSL